MPFRPQDHHRANYDRPAKALTKQIVCLAVVLRRREPTGAAKSFAIPIRLLNEPQDATRPMRQDGNAIRVSRYAR
jgi:hypothetical protein